jgi:Zn-dependent metalloprotease
MKRYLVLLALSIWTLPTAAQTIHSKAGSADPRPLHGLDISKLPRPEPFERIRERAVPGGALRGASYVGRAEIMPLPATGHGTVPGAVTTSIGTGMWRVMRAENGTVNWMWRLGGTQSTAPTILSMTGIAQQLAELSHILRLVDPAHELRMTRDEVDEKGLHHYHFDQLYQGVPVWKRDLAVHLNAEGQIETINGTYEPTPAQAEVTPSISSSSAIATAIDHLKSAGQWANDDPSTLQHYGVSQSSATLVLYPEKSGMRLIYDVDVHPNLLQHYSYLIDAKSGSVIRRIALHCALTTEKTGAGQHVSRISGLEEVAQTALGKGVRPQSGFVASSGKDLNGVTQNFRTYQHTDNTYYMLWDLSNFNAAKSTLPNEMSGGCVTIDLRNTDAGRDAKLFHVNSSDNTWNDKSAISAHTNMSACYEYYRSTFGRKAIDGGDASIVSVIHVTEGGTGMDNAYWNGAMMLYGDGKSSFKPLAGGLDVAAHEMTHGVTGHSADLLYEGQSGALNESFSDVFGVLVDTRNYLIGEDVMQSGQGNCLRNMENPGDPQAGSQQPSTMSEFRTMSTDQDNGGVHVNSGIPNHAAVLIMKSLGRDKAQRIYYLALTKYLTRNSQFIDCRLGCEAAANELFGANSNETKAVSDAFAAVGIGGSSSGGGGNDVPAQTGGADYIVFMVEAGNIGVLQPSTEAASLFNSPSAVARTSTTSAGIDRCQLSAPRTGKDIWFVSQSGLLSYIVSATGDVFNFPSLAIQQVGDIWNASVSPDESYVAIASSYAKDPNIYFFDGTSLGRIELLAQTQDGGAQETIQYPDVMNWSPNKSQPRLAFDAYNEDSFAGQILSYWSMYELNFQSGKIYNLVPTQPNDINIGNVTYSKTNPDLIAFNALDNTSADIVVASFENNGMVALNIPGRTIDGQTILDAERPTFSPNDRYLAFSSAVNHAMLYFDGTNNSLSYSAFAQALYNPHWMLVGGSAGVSTERTASSIGPVDVVMGSEGAATVRFSTRSEGGCRIDIVDLTGRIVRAAYAGTAEAGSQSVSINTSGLTADAYLVRVTVGDKSVAYGKFVIR